MIISVYIPAMDLSTLLALIFLFGAMLGMLAIGCAIHSEQEETVTVRIQFEWVRPSVTVLSEESYVHV